MIDEPAEIIWASHQWVVLRIATRSCWVVISQEELKAGLQRGKWFKRHLARQARIKVVEDDRGKD